MSSTDRETKAWKLRAEGKTTKAIAEELGITRQGVEATLQRLESRELGRLARWVDSVKVTQHHQLETIIEESFHAWFESKKPLKRARREMTAGDDDGPGAPGSEVMSTDVIERTGDVAYLDMAMKAMDGQAELWGLYVLPAANEQASSISQLMADLKKRGEEQETR
jgi:hypothetical protein